MPSTERAHLHLACTRRVACPCVCHIVLRQPAWHEAATLLRQGNCLLEWRCWLLPRLLLLLTSHLAAPAAGITMV